MLQSSAEPEMNGSHKIFVVEDDLDIVRLVRHHLETAGFRVRTYVGTANVLADARKERPSLLLLDIMVPGGDGLDLLRQVRQAGPPLAGMPIVFLTAKTTEADRVLGLDTGADDYITKPFSPRELLARIRAVLRRCERPLAPVSINAGELKIDAAAMTVHVRGDQILDAVWKETTFVSPRSVDVYVRKLREKIEHDPERPRYLKTVRGTGYRFEIPK